MVFRQDPRAFQVAALGALLAANIAWFDFGAGPLQSAITIAASLVAQAIFCRLFRVPFDWRSPLVTGLSLSILLRTHEPALWMAAPLLAVGSKFLLRFRGKHLFNPAAFAIATLLLVSDQVWVSPGQWGTATWLVLLIVSAGGLVLTRSDRVDTAAGFAVCYGGLLLWRCLWLGDPLTIPLHQVQTGSLLLFTFFMITDPRSTPDSRAGRMVFTALTAAVAYQLQFVWQVRTGLYFALVAGALATPVLDIVLPAARFRWRAKEA